jgi:hypothetical protein
MKTSRWHHVWILGLLISVFSFSGCAGTNLYSINISYDAKQAAIPASLKAYGKTSDAIISVAEFNDARQMDDRLVIGRVVEDGGIKYLVVPKNVKATKAISSGIKEYLRKAGYKVPNKIEQWDLKEENIPQGVANIVIGGNIDELEIYCRRGLPTNSYNTKIKLTVVFANMVTGKILYTSQVESDYSREHLLFSENVLEDQADIALGGAIEKLFEDKVVAQKIKEAIAQ